MSETVKVFELAKELGLPPLELVDKLNNLNIKVKSHMSDLGADDAVRARSELGGGWLGWVVAVDDIAPLEARLGREAVNGNRHRPDGTELLWKQLGVRGLQADPQLPFFIEWDVDASLHPSTGATGSVSLECLEIAGDPARVSEWLGQSVDAPLEAVKVEWVAPNGTPGIVAAQFQTPNGLVRI